MKISLSFIILSTLLWSCGTPSQPINYGHIACDFCKMTVMDHRYGAQLITTKGKVFVFDAAECMINYMRAEENDRHEYSQILVTDYMTPTKLIDAQIANYLRSSELPSPMGAYITALESKENAESLQEKHGGMPYDWDALNDTFDKLPAIEHVQY